MCASKVILAANKLLMQGNLLSLESSPEFSPGFITSLSYTIAMYVLAIILNKLILQYLKTRCYKYYTLYNNYL